MNDSHVNDPAAFPTAFDHALNTANIEALLALYDPSATFRASDGSTQHGMSSLRNELDGLMRAKAELHNTLRQVFLSEDTALILVAWTLRLTIPESGEIERKGTATNVLRHTREHGWRMLIANPQGIE